MKKMFILAIMLIVTASQVSAEQYTYKLNVPVDIDAIPGNKIVKNGRTYNLRYYIFHAMIAENGSGRTLEYIERRVIPVSNSGIHATLSFSKTFDHKINGNYFIVRCDFCEDSHGNSCFLPPSSIYTSYKKSSVGNFTKVP